MTRPVVLATRSTGLGDLCTVVPALRALRRGFPDHDLVVATPERFRPIALAAGADDVVHTEGLAPLPRSFHGVDVAVNLHGCGPESIERLIALEPLRLITHRHATVPASWDGPEWVEDCHEVDRWCRLLEAGGIPADPDELTIETPCEAPPEGTVGAVLVHPGAAAPGRRWPTECFAAVAQWLTSHGMCVAVTGSEREREICAAVAESVDRRDLVHDLAGTTDVAALAAAVGAARAVVCNDTGVAHLAVALGTPSVVLFGPTPPDRWGPPPASSRHRAIWKGIPGDPHAQTVHPGLARIRVDEVLDALGQVTATAAL